MDKINALRKEAPKSSLPSSVLGGHSKKVTINEPGSELSWDTPNVPAL